MTSFFVMEDDKTHGFRPVTSLIQQQAGTQAQPCARQSQTPSADHGPRHENARRRDQQGPTPDRAGLDVTFHLPVLAVLVPVPRWREPADSRRLRVTRRREGNETLGFEFRAASRSESGVPHCPITGSGLVVVPLGVTMELPQSGACFGSAGFFLARNTVKLPACPIFSGSDGAGPLVEIVPPWGRPRNPDFCCGGLRQKLHHQCRMPSTASGQ
jgi:hypothetical protein